jgi:hypothetical protein
MKKAVSVSGEVIMKKVAALVLALVVGAAVAVPLSGPSFAAPMCDSKKTCE